MSEATTALRQTQHRNLIEELSALVTAEERLSWLIERAPLHARLSDSDKSPLTKVPGCLSGLWLTAHMRDGVCYFAAYSDSNLVHGVVSFICDLYSSRAPEEIITLGDSLIQMVKLDGLLSTTRKRALLSTLSFILNNARHCAPSGAPLCAPAL